MKIYAASHLLPVSSPPVDGGALVVHEGKIVAVGSLSELTSSFQAPVTEFPGCCIMPGLVNAHSHLDLTHFPSWKIRKGIDYSPRTYVDWVIQVIKIRRALSRREREHSILEGIRISAESGTTCLGEILTDPEPLHLYRRSPLAGRLFLEAIGQDPLKCASFPAILDEALANLGGELLPGISPHAPHTLSAGFMGDIGKLAASHALPMAIHVAESRAELDFMFDSSGPIAEKLYPFVGWQDYLPPPRRTTPVAYLDGLGVLRPGTIAVHCVHLTPADAETLKRRGVSVVLCPRSNDRLDVGTAPVGLLKKAGIPLALGTDSLASNDSLSLFDEMRFLLGRFPEYFAPAEALRMATLSGAEILGLHTMAGSLEPGKRADFLVVSLPEWLVTQDLYAIVIEEGKLLEAFIAGNAMVAGETGVTPEGE